MYAIRCVIATLLVGSVQAETPQRAFDVIVVEGTSSGVAAAISAAREGLKVVVVEPSQRLGGMLSSGISKTDIPGNWRHVA